MKHRFTLSIALATALSIVGASAVVAQDDERPNPKHPAWDVIPRAEEIAGHSYQHWINEYGTWFFWDRTLTNPPPDALQDCNGGQPNGDVFFIPHTQFGNTTPFDCDVRSDQYLLLWVGGTMGWVEDGQTHAGRLAEFYSGYDHIQGFEFTVDGETVPAGGHTNFEPDFYSVELAEDNVFGVPAGPRDVFIVGSFVMLEPFEAGEHEVTVQNSIFHPARGHAEAVATSTLNVTDATAVAGQASTD